MNALDRQSRRREGDTQCIAADASIHRHAVVAGPVFQHANEHLVGNPTFYPAALVQLAGLEFRAGDRPGAIAHMRAALAIDDRNVAVLNNLAYYLSEDDPDGALKYAEQAAEASPDNPGIQDTLGWIYYRKGLYRNAAPHLKSAVYTKPIDQREFHLAMCYLKLGDREVGQNLLHSAISKDPELQKVLAENQ